MTNDKILHSLNRKVVLDARNGRYNSEFKKCFLYLLNKIEGNLYLVIISGLFHDHLDESANYFEKIIRAKIERGNEINLVYYDSNMKPGCSCINRDIRLMQLMENVPTTFSYQSLADYHRTRWHSLSIDQISNVKVAKTIIDVVDNCNHEELKEYFVKIVQLLESNKPIDLQNTDEKMKSIRCYNCRAKKIYFSGKNYLEIDGLTWLDCADCELL